MKDIEFKLIHNFKCKRCGCTNYDQLIFTGNKTLDEDDAIILKRYVCRNCDLPIDLNDYISTNTNGTINLNLKENDING